MNTTTNTFNVLFHLRNSVERENKLSIYARITIDGKRIEWLSKEMINPFDWNEKRGMAKPINDITKN